jgi:hypothetical protein
VTSPTTQAEREATGSPWIAVVTTALLAAFVAMALAASRESSLTWDEPSYIASGYAQITGGEFRFNPSHPPLAQQLVAAPLLLLDVNAPPAAIEAWTDHDNPTVAYAKTLLFRSGNDPRRLGSWARLPILLVGALTVVGVYLLAKRHFGGGPALVGMAMAAFSPDLLAHSGFATEDVVCTATMFAAVIWFDSALGRHRLSDWIVCGVATGLALASKHTSLLLGPIYIVLALTRSCDQGVHLAMRQRALGLSLVAVAAAVTVGASYDLTFDYHLYWTSLTSVYGDLRGGYQHYLLGSVSDTALPHYHFVAFVIKSPPTFLLAIAWAAFRLVRNRESRDRCLLLLVPPIVVFTAACFDANNFGVRRIMPALPFLFVATSAAIAGQHRLAAGVAIVVLAACNAISTIRVLPYPLSYCSELAGGASRGPYLLDDSNIDWGQDLPALAKWQAAHPEVRELRLSYFGTADPKAYGVAAIPMTREEIARPGPGWYAISVHQLAWFRKLRQRGHDVPDWLRDHQPVDTAGTSIWLYRF